MLHLSRTRARSHRAGEQRRVVRGCVHGWRRGHGLKLCGRVMCSGPLWRRGEGVLARSCKHRNHLHATVKDKPDEKILIIKYHVNVTHGSEGLSYGSEMMVKTSWLKTERLNLKISELEPKFIKRIFKLLTNIALYKQLDLNLISNKVNSNSCKFFHTQTTLANIIYNVIYHIC